VTAAKPLFVFDLDGTLVDSQLDLAASANELLAEYGAEPLAIDAVTAMVGEGAKVLVERVLTARGVSVPIEAALDAFLAIYERHLAIHTTLYPGVRDALDALATQAQLAVLTNKPSRHTRLLLEALEVDGYFFQTIAIGDDFPRKPDPTGLLHLVARAGVDPASTVMVGDSMVDVETARRAGTRLIVALYGLGRFGDSPDFPVGAVTVADSRQLGPACLALMPRL
jgi:phosphoglycolate phosphatase